METEEVGVRSISLSVPVNINQSFFLENPIPTSLSTACGADQAILPRQELLIWGPFSGHSCCCFGKVSSCPGCVRLSLYPLALLGLRLARPFL